MKGPLDIHQHLLAHDVRHEILRLPRVPSGALTLAEALAIPPHRCVATYPFYASTSVATSSAKPTTTTSAPSSTPSAEQLVLLLAPANLDVDLDSSRRALTDLLAARLGARAQLSVAGARLVSERTDYLAGHLSPLLLPPDVIVVAAQQLADLGAATVYTATGDAGTALALRAADLLALTNAIVLPARRRPARRRPVSIDLNATEPAAEVARPPLRTPAVGPPIASRAAS